MPDDDTRPVWLTEAHMDNPDWMLAAQVRERFRAAPADATAAARSALTDCEYRSPGMGGEAEHISELYNIEGCRIIRSAAVLRALGMPHSTRIPPAD